jgi:hypothetical protein
VPFGRSLPKSGRDRPQCHFPESATEKPRRREQILSGGHSAALLDRLQVHDRGTPRKSTHAMCGADRRSPKSRGAPRRRPFQPGRRKQKPQAPRPTRSLQKEQGALRQCSAAGHSAKAYVTGCKATIRVCHGKTKAACHVSCRPALPARARERLVDDLFNLDGKAIRRRRTLRCAT